jgi:hypothetical protein
MGMCALYEGCALSALVGSTLVGSWLPDAKYWADFNSSPMTAIHGSRIGLVVPSIAHAIISLCFRAEWQG